MSDGGDQLRSKAGIAAFRPVVGTLKLYISLVEVPITKNTAMPASNYSIVTVILHMCH